MPVAGHEATAEEALRVRPVINAAVRLVTKPFEIDIVRRACWASRPASVCGLVPSTLPPGTRSS